MTHEADLFATLHALVSDRMHAVDFPQEQNPIWPKLRYLFVDSVPIQDACGDGEEATDQVRVQIDAVARTVPQLRALVRNVRLAMVGFPNTPARLDLIGPEERDDLTTTYRRTLDYLLHGSSPAPAPAPAPAEGPALDFSKASNSQYLTLVSVGGM